MNETRGFTFVEILVVILIIGITLGFALLAFGDFGEGRQLRLAAEQLAETIRLAQQEAILESQTLGLLIDTKGYQIVQLRADVWVPTKRRVTYFPKNARITIRASTKPILINPTGDMTAFTLDLGTSREPQYLKLIGNYNGNLILNTGKTK